MIKSVVELLNSVSYEKRPPEDWKEMIIKSIYKNKGSQLDMKNRRGLFLTDVISKVFEKLISARNEKQTQKTMSRYQSGGIKNRSTIDHVMTMMAIIDKNLYLKRPTFLVFADAEKCFDKLWLKDGIKDLWKAGTRTDDAYMIYKMNEKANAQIDTPIGKTDPIELQEIVRQGTIYGPKICGTSTDKINKIGKKSVTMYSPNIEIEKPDLC